MEIKSFGSGSSGNCYLATFNNELKVLLDCGVDIKKVLSVLNLKDLDFCFISHQHQDHAKYSDKLRSRRVSIVEGYNSKSIEKKVFKSKKTNQNYIIHIIPIKHGDEPNGAIAITTKEESLLYATDFNLCEYDLKGFKFNKVMVECNFIEEEIQEQLKRAEEENDFGKAYKLKRQINTHMGLKGVINFLKSLDLTKCDEIILVHQSRNVCTNLVEMIMATRVLETFNIDVSVANQFGGFEKYEVF